MCEFNVIWHLLKHLGSILIFTSFLFYSMKTLKCSIFIYFKFQVDVTCHVLYDLFTCWIKSYLTMLSFDTYHNAMWYGMYIYKIIQSCKYSCDINTIWLQNVFSVINLLHVHLRYLCLSYIIPCLIVIRIWDTKLWDKIKYHVHDILMICNHNLTGPLIVYNASNIYHACVSWCQ